MSDGGIPPEVKYRKKMIKGRAYFYAYWYENGRQCQRYIGKQLPEAMPNSCLTEEKTSSMPNLCLTKELLHHALTLRANKGGAIKIVIREALQLLAG